MEDRALVWMLIAYGLDSAPSLRREILDQHDTRTLYIWRVQAAALIEEIVDVLDGRSGDDNFPKSGM